MKSLTILERILLTIVGVVMLGWLTWISTTVVSLASKQREDSAQWDKMKRLENRINSYHAKP